MLDFAKTAVHTAVRPFLAGLAIKNPPNKTPKKLPENPPLSGFFGFYCFFLIDIFFGAKVTIFL
jgi:hypothetical protein